MSRGKDFLRGILIGGISAGVALLFAPKSGKELRQDLKNSAEDLMERGETAFEDLSQDIQTSIQEVDEEKILTRTSDQKALEEAIVEQEQDIVDDIVEHSETVVTEDGEVTSIERPHGSMEDREEEAEHLEATPENELAEALDDQGIDDLSELD